MIWIRKCHAGWNSVPVSQWEDQMDRFSKPVCLCSARICTVRHRHRKYDNVGKSNRTPASAPGRSANKKSTFRLSNKIFTFYGTNTCPQTAGNRFYIAGYQRMEDYDKTFTFTSVLLKNKCCRGINLSVWCSEQRLCDWVLNSKLGFKAKCFHVKATCNHGYHTRLCAIRYETQYRPKSGHVFHVFLPSM